MAIRNGEHWRLYYSTSYSSPSWQSIGLIQDVTGNRSRESTTVKVRGIEEEIGISSKVNRSIQGPILYDGDNALLDTLETAFEDKTKIVLFLADGDITEESGKGRKGWFEITNYSINAPIDGEATIDFEAVPAYVEGEPNVKITVGGS